MGLFDRLVRLLGGPERQRSEHSSGENRASDREAGPTSGATDGRDGGSVTADEDRDGRSATGTDATGQGSTRGATVPALLGELTEAPVHERRAALYELLDLLEADPSRVADHAEEVVASLSGPAAHEAAILLAALADRDPHALSAHVDRLVAALDREDDATREQLGDALCLLAGLVELPVEALVTYLEATDSPCRWEAAAVLGRVATTRPEALDPDRLEALLEEGEATAGPARYLLALLTAQHRDVSLPASDEDLCALAVGSREAGLLWVAEETTEEATASIVYDRCPTTTVEVSFAKTPMGTQLVVEVDDPEEVDADALQAGIENRLNLDLAGFDLQEA